MPNPALAPRGQAKLFAKTIETVQPDLVHFNACVDLASLALLKWLRIPFVTHYRVCDLPRYREQLRLSDAVIAVSNFCRSHVLELDIDPVKVHVLYDEADTDYFSPGSIDGKAARRSLELEPGHFVVLHIARFAPNKRHDVLLSAVMAAKEKIPELHVVLKGESLGDVSTLDDVVDFIDENDMGNGQDRSFRRRHSHTT